MLPETRYARSGDVNIAYQVVGQGPFDLVLVPGYVSNVEYGWEEPSLASFYRRLASFCRLIIFDKRGTGLSDRVTRMADVRAIIDAAESERAALLGYSEGAAMAVLFAGTYPERAPALVLYGAFLSPELNERPGSSAHRPQSPGEIEQRWGTPDYCDELLREDAPSVADDEGFRRWYATRLRLGASPAAAVELVKMAMDTDARPILPTINVPTLILHRVGDRTCSVQNARFAAEQIPESKYAELPGVDHLPWVGDSDGIIREIDSFLTDIWKRGGWEEAEPERVLATVLFTDIVGSSEKAASLGDRAWRELLERHHEFVRRRLTRFRGTEVDTAGDGFLASFDGPARAISCACAIVEGVRDLGLEVRARLHTGECEVVDGKVAGIAVHTGARVASQARPGEVLVSGTVKDLVAGSGLTFRERGQRQLKGIPGEWPLYAVGR